MKLKVSTCGNVGASISPLLVNVMPVTMCFGASCRLGGLLGSFRASGRRPCDIHRANASLLSLANSSMPSTLSVPFPRRIVPCLVCFLSIKAHAIPPSFQLHKLHTLRSDFHRLISRTYHSSNTYNASFNNYTLAST